MFIQSPHFGAQETKHLAQPQRYDASPVTDRNTNLGQHHRIAHLPFHQARDHIYQPGQPTQTLYYPPHITTAMPPPSIVPSTRKRKLLPLHKVDSSSASELSDVEGGGADDVEWAPESSRPRRVKKAATSKLQHEQSVPTGRPKGKGMSREQLRKVNHSMIERRRREKINAALDELRNMVPGLGDNGGKGGEFKLEVLEKTVEHMKELRGQLAGYRFDKRSVTTASRESCSRLTELRTSDSQHNTPCPSPSPDKRSTNLSPDPNETDTDSNPPPPLATAAPRHRFEDGKEGFSPLMCATGNTNGTMQTTTQPVPKTRPKPPPNASSPIFLPFPAPSPTSPFMNAYHHKHIASHGNTPSATTGTTAGSSEPSPFLPPIPNLSLFGGMVSLDGSPVDTFRPPKPRSPLPHLSLESSSATGSAGGTSKSPGSSKSSMPPPPAPSPPSAAHTAHDQKGSSDMPPEEAANLLLAFSSPETLRPQSEALIAAQNQLLNGVDGRKTGKKALDEFNLDTGHGVGGENESMRRGGWGVGGGKKGGGVVGKSVREILRLS